MKVRPSARTYALTCTVVASLLLAGCATGRNASSGAGGTASPTRSASAGPSPEPTKATAPPPASVPAVTLPDRYDPTRNATADVQAALTLAAADHRQVLLDFGADWCPDCVVLQKLFKSGEVTPLLEKGYHVAAIDVGKFDRNLDVAGRYVDLKRSGIPALVILSPQGTVRVATNDGSFADARTMRAADVVAFLTRWTPAG